jgi:hypothetical protein
VQERFAVCPGLFPIARGLLSIARGLRAVSRGTRSALGGARAVGSPAPAVLRGPRDDLRGVHRTPAAGRGGVAGRQLAVIPLRGLIARQRREIASSRGLVAIGGCGHALVGAVLSLQGAPIAELPREVMDTGVAAVREVAIAGGLVGVSGSLVAIGRDLIAVRGRLVGVRERLIASSERLTVPIRDRTGRDRLVMLAARPVGGGRIARR